MPEIPDQSEQNQPLGNHPNQRVHTEPSPNEEINSPQRLAQVVLNTLELTFDNSLLHIDRERINDLMKKPTQNWSSIFDITTNAVENAKLLGPQIATMDYALFLVSRYNETLPLAQAGNPPRAIIDRRGIVELLEKHNQEADAEIDPNKRKDPKYQKERQKKLEDEIYKDPIRRLAFLISKFQQDTLSQNLSIARNYHQLFSRTHPPSQDIMEGFMIGIVDAEINAIYGRKVLQQYTEGKLPDETTIRSVVTSGTAGIAKYLQTTAA